VRLLPLTLTSPGRYGLNKERSNSLLSPDWATEALNCVLNREGRIAARKGWVSQTTGQISGAHDIDVLFEYLQDDGDTAVISAANNKLYVNIDDYTVAANDVTSSTAPTGDDWQFVNFNGAIYGFQQSHTPVSKSDTGTTNFADLTAASGTVPTGNAACAAFGRLWVADDDGQTLQYCGLLAPTQWGTSGGGGSIDMRNVWTKGMDRIVAVAAFGANLIVFGRNHIIFYADGSGSTLGVDPDQMYVVDTIEGTGCIARDSVQLIGEGDLMYLSRHGLQMLGRTIRERSNPTATVSKNIRTYLSNLLTTQPAASIRSGYSPENGFYLLVLPTAARVIVADTRFGFEDDDGSFVLPMLEWEFEEMPTSILVRNSGDVLLGFGGVVGKYQDNLDNADTYTVSFSSPWLAMHPEVVDRLKILKEIPTIVQLNGDVSVGWIWEFDFNGELFTGSTSYSFDGSASEWNVAEYSVDEFGGGLTLQSRTVDGAGEGQFIRVALRVTINSVDFVLQQIKLLFKLGRMA
jgi:hypothetical protein